MKKKAVKETNYGSLNLSFDIFDDKRNYEIYETASDLVEALNQKPDSYIVEKMNELFK